MNIKMKLFYSNTKIGNFIALLKNFIFQIKKNIKKILSRNKPNIIFFILFIISSLLLLKFKEGSIISNIMISINAGLIVGIITNIMNNIDKIFDEKNKYKKYIIQFLCKEKDFIYILLKYDRKSFEFTKKDYEMVIDNLKENINELYSNISTLDIKYFDENIVNDLKFKIKHYKNNLCSYDENIGDNNRKNLINNLFVKMKLNDITYENCEEKIKKYNLLNIESLVIESPSFGVDERYFAYSKIEKELFNIKFDVYDNFYNK